MSYLSPRGTKVLWVVFLLAAITTDLAKATFVTLPEKSRSRATGFKKKTDIHTCENVCIVVANSS